MQVAVTGATGFLGHHVATRLLADGHDPVCLARPASDRGPLEHLGVALREGTLHDAESLRRLVKGCDAVVHAAGTLTALRPAHLHAVNGEGTRRLAAAAAAEGVGPFVLVSSLAAKGPSPAPDQPRPWQDPAPISHYGRSKRAGEEALLATDGLEPRILRPPVLYGPRDAALLNLFRAVQRGLFPLPAPRGAHLDLLYGPDCADAVVAALHIRSPQPVVAEPADGPPHAWEAFRDAVAAALDVASVRSPRLPAWTVHATGHAAGLAAWARRRPGRFNPDKAREVRAPHWATDPTSLTGLAWQAKTDLHEGCRRTVAWYRQEGWLPAGREAAS